MAGDTLASIAQRLGDASKADDIHDANKAVIPDKTKLTPGIQLAIPGVSPTWSPCESLSSCASHCGAVTPRTRTP